MKRTIVHHVATHAVSHIGDAAALGLSQLEDAALIELNLQMLDAFYL